LTKTIKWLDDRIRLLDQTKLPGVVEYIDCSDYREVGAAIRELKVRGAPAIGVAAAMAIALHAISVKVNSAQELAIELAIASQFLKNTRPTAVNLFWALDRMTSLAHRNENNSLETVQDLLVSEALQIAAEDEQMCRKIGFYGQEIVPQDANILTHCNAGALATAGYGTALGVIRAAKEAGKNIHVYVDETRPLLQGARLTAWELVQEKIPATLITDSMAGHFLYSGKVDLVIVGADRIVESGDTANKIGTYPLAVLAKENNIPFYVAAPTSTIDLTIASGEDIVIEERKPEEISIIGGQRFAPEGINIANPAFDVTPHRYISGIITEKGIVRPPFPENLMRLFSS
jgi:methylthioribose-1-phosphate isomerase